MTNESTDSTDAPTPKEDDLWVLYQQMENGDQLAIARVLYETEYGFSAEILYDAYSNIETPYTIGPVEREDFYARLPDEEFDDRFEDCLDYILGLITRKEAAEVLDGESLDTNGERGYEAARFWVLDGIHESITEWSVGHGHGPSRYGRAVESRIEDLPTWLAESVLYSEKERWDGGLELTEDAASNIVEILMLREEYLDEDNEDELRDIVQQYDLEYDEYREVEC